MLKVVFIRHAKSRWNQPNLVDYNRGVAERGRNDIDKVGKFLKNKQIIPDLVLSSGANRALTTAKGISNLCGYRKEIVVKDELYFGGRDAILNLLKELPKEVKQVFVVFHNPDINEIAIDLLRLETENIPTLGMVFTNSNAISWANWNTNNCDVVSFVNPKKLPE